MAAELHWLRTDEATDVVVSLAEVDHQLGRVESNLNCWKWAVIALCSALNGALACHLTGSAGVGALKEECAKTTLEALQSPDPTSRPAPFMASPNELWKRAKSPNGSSYRLETAGDAVSASEAQNTAFKKVFGFRNEFIHYKPSSWSIETSGFPNIFGENLRIIEMIYSLGYAFRHLPDDKDLRLKTVLNDLRQLLKEG